MLRLPAVLDRVGVHEATLYRWMREKKFPAPVRLGANSVAWREHDVDEWLASRVEASR